MACNHLGHVIRIDDSVFPYRVQLSLSGLVRIGLVECIDQLICAYCELLKIPMHPATRKVYATLLVQVAPICIAQLRQNGRLSYASPAVNVRSAPSPGPQVFGWARRVPGGPHEVGVSTDAPIGRAIVTIVHELGHVAEYVSEHNMAHPDLHVLSVMVASEIMPVISKLRKGAHALDAV